MRTAQTFPTAHSYDEDLHAEVQPIDAQLDILIDMAPSGASLRVSVPLRGGTYGDVRLAAAAALGVEAAHLALLFRGTAHDHHPLSGQRGSLQAYEPGHPVHAVLRSRAALPPGSG